MKLREKIRKSKFIYRLFFPERLQKRSLFSRLFSRANYRRNLEISRDIRSGEYLALQGGGLAHDRLRFGISSFARSGCEVMAAYNALLKMNAKRPIADLIRSFERRGASFGGLFGASPFAIVRLLCESGLDAVIYDSEYARDYDALAASADACIFTFWWGDDSLVIHTVMLEKAPEGRGFLAVNLYRNEAASRIFGIEALIKERGLEPISLITVRPGNKD